MVDDVGIDGAFDGFEFEAEFILDSVEDGGRDVAVGAGRGSRRRVVQLEVVAAGEAGAVDDDTVDADDTGIVGELPMVHCRKLVKPARQYS